MKPLGILGRSGRNWTYSAFASSISTLALTLTLGLPLRTDAATNTVTSLADSGAGSLRQVIADSTSGDTILFSVAGVITLAGTELVIDRDLTIDGPGLSVLAISANYASRVLRIATNVSVSLSGLTLRNGRPWPDPGGGIHNSGTLLVHSCMLSNNATSIDMTGAGIPGGGIYNVGTLALDNSSVSFNRTAAGLDGAAGADYGHSGSSGGYGGGIWNSGNFSANLCRISDNATGNGGNGSHGRVGGGPGGSGGDGGGIYNVGAIRLTSCTVSNNSTGSGGSGAVGQAGAGAGGWGGGGGGILSVNSVLIGCTVVSNHTGNGGAGASALTPGPGGPGGRGGGINVWGALWLTNCTVAGNSSGGGGPGPIAPIWFPVGGGNGGDGGGVYSSATNFSIVACTVVHNTAGPGGPAGGGAGFPGWDGRGGGIYVVQEAAGLSLNNIVALNSGQGSNVFGAFTSLGCNLVGTTNGASGFSAPGDLAGSDAAPLDPGVGPLGDYGGPTPTVPLMLDSAAIDSGAASGIPATDQRGVARPQGLRADIGAFEFQVTLPRITGARYYSSSQFWIQSCGQPDQTYALQVSTDLLSWSNRTDIVIGPDGMNEFTDSDLGGYAFRFYRLKSVSP